MQPSQITDMVSVLCKTKRPKEFHSFYTHVVKHKHNMKYFETTFIIHKSVMTLEIIAKTNQGNKSVIWFGSHYVNSLWPCDAEWRHRSWSRLAQPSPAVMFLSSVRSSCTIHLKLKAIAEYTHESYHHNASETYPHWNNGAHYFLNTMTSSKWHLTENLLPWREEKETK